MKFEYNQLEIDCLFESQLVSEKDIKKFITKTKRALTWAKRRELKTIDIQNYPNMSQLEADRLHREVKYYEFILAFLSQLYKTRSY